MQILRFRLIESDDVRRTKTNLAQNSIGTTILQGQMLIVFSPSGLIIRVPADLRPVFLRRPPVEASAGAAEIGQGEAVPGRAEGGKEVPQVGQSKIVYSVYRIQQCLFVGG